MIYAEHVMPAFANWLIDEDASAVYQLFEQTRCAREEQFLPEAMQRLRVWPRACAFLKTVPRGPHSRREYMKLCSAEEFTSLSDHYMYRHAPQLYQNSDAVRSIWGAIVEEYCLPWSRSMKLEEHAQAGMQEDTLSSNVQGEEVRSELVSLLHAAGLGDLAKEIDEPNTQVERFDWEAGEISGDLNEDITTDDLDALPDEESLEGPCGGIEIGVHPNTLHLRGWLAGIAVRAMALFEYLACGRRRMPFGYEPTEPFGAFIGYLTPDEVWQLAACLHDVKPPGQAEAEADYLAFRLQNTETADASRLVDEVLPAHAVEFLQAVRNAAFHGLGLICSVD
jgi:hypothetical protein